MADDAKVIRIIVDASRAVDGSGAATRALERMERAQSQAGASLDRLEKSLGRVGGYMKAHIALMIAEIGARLVQMGKDAFDAASGLDELAEQLGVTAKGLQGLQFSAAQNGVKIEQLEAGIGKFSQKMGEAADGSKEMVEALNRIGVKNLDLQGKLRPTEDILQDVAKAILEIDDPARRAAAAVDMFGKSGTRMLPMLADIAAGTDTMAERMKAAGAFIGPETVKRLDEMSDAAARSGLKWRAFFANMIADAADWYERNRGLFALMTGGLSTLVEQFAKDPGKITRAIGEAYDGLTTKLGDWQDAVRSAFDQVMIAGARFGAGFIESLRSIPEQLGKLFVDGMNLAIVAMEDGLREITAKFADSWLGRRLGVSASDSPSFGRIGGGGASLSDRNNQIRSAEDAAEAALRERGYGRDYAAERQEQRQIAFAQWFALQETSAAGLPPARSTGGGLSAVKGAGKEAEDAAAKYAKLMQQLTATAEAQDHMTAAARQGDVAFDAQKVRLDAVQKGLEIFGKRLDDNDPRLRALEDVMGRIARGKLAESFNVATTELEKQNVLLEAEIRLMDALPEIRARELAAIKTRNDAQKAGNALTQEDIDNRIKAADANERLKAQAEELRRVNELWTAPLKSALESIQRTGADAFEEILNSGRISFESLGQVFKRTITRMAAEFLALATIRPVMSVLVSGVAATGLISPAQASAMGYGGNYGGGASGFSIPSLGMGGGGSWLGGIGDWLNTPLTGPYAGLSPSAMQGVPMLSGAAGLTPLSLLGGLGSIGFGAYGLASGNRVGGAAGVLGGGLSLAGAAGLLGSWAGPVGMGVGLIGGLLGGLLGGGTPEPPTMRATGGLNFRGGRFTASGSEYGGASSVVGTLGGIGTGLDALLRGAGVTLKDGSFGLTYQTFAKGDFSNATTFVNGKQWGQGSGADAGLDTAAAHIAHKIMLEVDSGISEVMRRGLSNFGKANLQHAFSTQELGTAVSEIKALEEVMKDLGRTIGPAEQALRQIDEQFKGILETAKKYDLDVAKVESEQAKARTRVATDFAAGLQRQYDDLTGNTTKGALADIARDYEAAVANNKYLVENVKGATDQILLIEKLFNEQRTKIAIDMWQQVPDLARGQYLFGERLKLNEQLQAINDDTAAIGANPMETQIKGWQREIGQFMKGVGDVFGVGSEEYRNATVAAYRRYNAQLKAANDDFIQTMRDMVTALEDPFKAQIDGILRQRDAAMQAARALDASGKLLVEASLAYAAPLEKMGRDFNKSVADQLLQMRDPLAFALQQNREARDADIRKATQINEALQQVYQPTIDAIIERATSYDERGNLTVAVTDAGDQAFLRRISDNYVKMLDITELYLQKEQRLKEDYYRQTLTGLDDLIKRLSYGDLSGLSPTATLAGTRGAYQAAYAQAAADPRNQANLDRFTALAADLSTQLRSYYGSSEQYYRDIASIRANAEAVRSMVTGGGASSSSGTVDPGVQAAMNSNTELTRALLAEMQQMREDNKDLKHELKRLLSKVAA